MGHGGAYGLDMLLLTCFINFYFIKSFKPFVTLVAVVLVNPGWIQDRGRTFFFTTVDTFCPNKFVKQTEQHITSLHKVTKWPVGQTYIVQNIYSTVMLITSNNEMVTLSGTFFIKVQKYMMGNKTILYCIRQLINLFHLNKGEVKIVCACSNLRITSYVFSSQPQGWMLLNPG